MIFIEIIIGAIAAIILAFLFQKKAVLFWRMALVIAALIYVGFALIEMQWDWLPIEFGGVLLYSIFVLLSIRYSILFLALGWALHVAWDLGLHFGGHPGFVPEWYPGVCIGFDLFAGCYLIWHFSEKNKLKKLT